MTKQFYRNACVYAINNSNDRGLDVFLKIFGVSYYLYSRNRNRLLYKFLKDGKTIAELSEIKPGRDSISQKQLHYSKQVLKIIRFYLELGVT